MKTILFQGDSITDAGRIRTDPENLGTGYPLLVAASLGLAQPGAYRFLNRGVSGDRSVDIYARIKRDILNLRPDVMTLLMGVNDVWHEFDIQNGVDPAKFRRISAMLLTELRQALPQMKIILLGPYVFKGDATASRWEDFQAGVGERAQILEALAQEYGLPFVSLQKEFDQALAQAPGTYWTYDGVHPTPFGHQLIARAVTRALEDALR